MRLNDTASSRFWSKVERTEHGCWNWRGPVNRETGYGSFGTSAEQTRSAHRVSYTLTYGPIPDGLHVLHTCDVKTCVRPDHLWLGTNRDNMRDAQRKGRLAYGDRNSSRLRPERLQRGDAHYWRRHPEAIPRGENHSQAKLTAAQVATIRTLIGTKSLAQIGRDYGVTLGTIWNIKAGKSW